MRVDVIDPSHHAETGLASSSVEASRRIGPHWTFALSEVSRRESLNEYLDAGAETPSITDFEGSRWRGGRLWSRKPGSPT